MQSVKKEALEAISSLPSSASMDDIMYRLYIIDTVRKGQEDYKKGRVMTSQELEKEMSTW